MTDVSERAFEATIEASLEGAGYRRDRAATCIDPRTQVVRGKTVCLVGCRRSPEPVFLKWKNTEKSADGDFYVRMGPKTARLDEEGVRDYVKTRFPAL